MLRVHVELLVPLHDWLKATFDALHDRVQEVLVSICEESSCVLGLDLEAAAERVEDELEAALCVVGLLLGIEVEDVDGLLGLGLLLRGGVSAALRTPLQR